MKAMAPSLDQRYGSADEMLEDWKEFRKNPDMAVSQSDPTDEPTMVVPPSRVNGSGNTGRRPQVQPEPERRRQRPEEDEGDYDEPPRRGGGVAAAVAAIAVILIFIGGMVFFLYNFLFKGMFEDAEEYQVPRVLGHTVEELQNNKALLGDFTLEIGDIVYSDVYAEGKICEQDPKAGSTVREGEMVITVNISGGEDKMYMQPVDGWDAREALRLLQNDMGLVVDVQEEFSDTITQGYVIRYSPMEGILVEKGDKVTIWVSIGPETPKVTVPNLINARLEDVERQLTSAGLTLGKVDPFPSDEYAEGRVSWQSQEPYKEGDKGTVIDLWVSTGPAETEPPETEPPATEPPEEPSTQPPSTEEPVPTENDVVVPTTTKPITVDLSDYERPLKLTIVVGGAEMFKGAVDADSKTVNVSASGTQLVEVYINEMLVERYYVDFTK